MTPYHDPTVAEHDMYDMSSFTQHLYCPGCFEIMFSSNSASTPQNNHPPVYNAYKLSSNQEIVIDGDIRKPVWDRVQWSVPFNEIRGAYDEGDPFGPPKDMCPTYHRCRTRMKMLWDDDYLYIAALLEYGVAGTGEEETHDNIDEDETTSLVSEIIATYTERNSPIFHLDSDFEVFIDVDGSCHNYKELEMNAWNTVWNLLMDKPYADGGIEHSGRVASDPSDPLYYEVTDQKTAAKLIKGTINGIVAGPHDGNVWAVEMALPHAETTRLVSNALQRTPQVGEFWRINFSRVEKKGDINWTWAPQVVWNAKEGRYTGKISMHEPESWGYVRFVDDCENGKGSSWHDPMWQSQRIAVACYHALHYYRECNGEFTNDLSALNLPSDPVFFDVSVEIILQHQLGTGDEFLVVVHNDELGRTVKVTNDRKITYSSKERKSVE
mmetsp:Transcript_15068/g.23385  ORF Transcript_15068/g.23385 Transcript_15068/m.23385 type:complete len:438 (+) Transcript_15068:103-1416(+)